MYSFIISSFTVILPHINIQLRRHCSHRQSQPLKAGWEVIFSGPFVIDAFLHTLATNVISIITFTK